MKKAFLFCSVLLLMLLASCGDDEPNSDISQSKLKGSWWLKLDQKIDVDENGNERTLWTELSRDFLFVFSDNGLMARCWDNGDNKWEYRIMKYEYDKKTNTIVVTKLYKYWAWNPKRLISTEDRIDEIYKIESISKDELILTTLDEDWQEQDGRKNTDYHYMSFEKVSDKAALEKLNIEEINWQYGYQSNE